MLASLALAVALSQQPMMCAAAGRMFACAEPTVSLCWDLREQQVVRCIDLPKDTDGPIRRASRIAIGHGIDLFSTAVAINAGAVEANGLIPSVEHRVGMKVIAAAIQIAGGEFIARWRPKLATWLSRISLGVFTLVGLHNLRQADIARRQAQLAGVP